MKITDFSVMDTNGIEICETDYFLDGRPRTKKLYVHFADDFLN